MSIISIHWLFAKLKPNIKDIDLYLCLRSRKTPLAKHNKGPYDFYLDRTMALPTDPVSTNRSIFNFSLTYVPR